jgi:hypothetical protein
VIDHSKKNSPVRNRVNCMRSEKVIRRSRVSRLAKTRRRRTNAPAIALARNKLPTRKMNPLIAALPGVNETNPRTKVRNSALVERTPMLTPSASLIPVTSDENWYPNRPTGSYSRFESPKPNFWRERLMVDIPLRSERPLGRVLWLAQHIGVFSEPSFS